MKRTGYPKNSLQTDVLKFRVNQYQKEMIDEYAEKYNTTVSAIMREALTIWLNMNSKKGEN